jgi:hypothetical protein
MSMPPGRVDSPTGRGWLTGPVKQSIDSAWDDHPAEPDDQEDTPPVWWIVNLVEVEWVGAADTARAGGGVGGRDVEGIDDLRVQVVLEVPGTNERVAAHLAPATVRRLRAALATALTTVGEEP